MLTPHWPCAVPGFSSCTKSELTLTNPMFLGTTGSGTLFLVDCEYGARPGMVT